MPRAKAVSISETLPAWHPLRAASTVVQELGLDHDPCHLTPQAAKEQACLTKQLSESAILSAASIRAARRQTQSPNTATLRLRLAQAGIKTTDLARQAGRSVKQIARVIAGLSNTPRIRALIAKNLGCAPEDLWFDATSQKFAKAASIGKLLDDSKLSLSDLARLVNRSEKQVYRTLYGKSQSIELRFKIAEALGRNAYEVWPDPQSWGQP